MLLLPRPSVDKFSFVERNSLEQALIMMPDTTLFVLLFFFSFVLNGVSAVVCNTCFGAALPLNHESVNCPYNKDVAANAAADEATALSVIHLLPHDLVAFLSRSLLERIKCLSKKVDPFNPFVCLGKTAVAISTAVSSGLLSSVDAANHASELMEDADEAKRFRGKAVFSFLATFKESSVVSERLHGVYIFVFAKATEYVASLNASGKKAVLGESSLTARLTANIVAPLSDVSFYIVLQIFQQILHATGVVNYLISAKFLMEVVYMPMASKNWSFQMAFCHLQVYLARVEDPSLGATNLCNVCDNAAVDSLREDAKNLGMIKYGESFRVLRGEPRDTPHGGANGGRNLATTWNNKFTKDSKNSCHAYTHGNDHKKESLLADGTCKYNHKCTQWVTDKGKDGQCGGPHRKAACNNAKRCNEPEK